MPNGLTTTEVKERKRQYGCNEIPAPRYRFFTILARQFKGVFNILLILASGFTYALGEVVDASLILLFVLLSVGLSLFQEYKSNSAAEKLKSYLIKTITVRRDGVDTEVEVGNLVPGDILKLEPGEIVPADAVILHTTGLQVDETVFTGESVPVMKSESKEGIGTQATEHILLQGTTVIHGLAFAEVTAIGMKTRLAQIVETAQGVQSESELTKGIDRISTFILRATVITLFFVVIANMLIEGSDADISHLLIFAIALAVSVIPEALPLHPARR